MVDSTREIRSMTLAMLPSPPLPAMCTRECEGETNQSDGEYHACNSHDMIAHFMDITAKFDNARVNEIRKVRQTAANEKMINKFDEWKKNNPDCDWPDAQVSYEIFAQFTREYIDSFIASLPGATSLGTTDIRVFPMETIGNDDPLRMKTISFTKAQDLVYGRVRSSPNLNVEVLSYPELIQLGALRILESG